MSLQVGLGASEDDIEVQGEIDFDFFEGDGDYDTTSKESDNSVDLSKTSISDFSNHSENNNTQNPVIRISYDGDTGTVRKTSIETVIPSPENYIGHKQVTSVSDCIRKKYGSVMPQKDSDECDYPDDSPCDSSNISTDVSSSSLSDDSSENSESDSITDVSPLPSPCELQSIDRNKFFKVPDKTRKCISLGNATTESQKDSRPCDKYKLPQPNKELDIKQLINSTKQLEINGNAKRTLKASSKNKYATISMESRKNFTFRNEEIRKIDRENQYLLKKIMQQQNRSKPRFPSTYSRPSSSSINRQKYQRQVELDNLALLKRLEAAKPSADLNRQHLLNDYERTTRSNTPLSQSSRMTSQRSSCRNSAQSSGRVSCMSSQSSSKQARALTSGSSQRKRPVRASSSQN